MSEEKSYKRNNELTKQQEIFCQEIAKGETQTDAYLVAYPKSKEWQREGVWVAASQLAKKDKIQKRIQQLEEDTQEDINWTRKKVLANINYLLDDNKGSVRRKKEIYEEMIQEKYNELIQWVSLRTVKNVDIKGVEKNIKLITNEIRQLELQKNNIQLNNKAIISALSVINRMQGYETTKVEIQENDKERENMEQLSVEELRQLINMNDKGEM